MDALEPKKLAAVRILQILQTNRGRVQKAAKKQRTEKEK